jgi:hypothetical protein
MAVHFRFVRPWPPRIEYRDATVTLAVVETNDTALGLNGWKLVATKVGVKAPAVVLHAWPASRQVFDHQLFNEGFSVSGHGPAFKLMERLEREGFAQRSAR